MTVMWLQCNATTIFLRARKGVNFAFWIYWMKEMQGFYWYWIKHTKLSAQSQTAENFLKHFENAGVGVIESGGIS